MRITLTGSVPSKKNSKRWVQRGNKRFLLPSKKYEDWHTDKSWELKLQRIGVVKEVEMVTLTFYPPTMHKADLSNKAESVMDLFVDNGVLEDDNWFIVPKLVLCFGGVDREHPRVEIEINEIT